MTVEYIRYRIPGDTAAFERACAAYGVGYELSRSIDDPGCYLLRITRGTAGDRAKAGFPPYAEAVEEMREYEPVGAVPTLYEWAGGAEAFERLTECFYEKVMADDVVGPLFAHMDPGHPRHVAMWLAEVFGGPARYTEERGGYSHMLAHHLGKAITEPRRRRWVSLLVDAADEVGLPDDPEFRAAFLGYIEWGTRLALANSQPGATPPQQAPVPRWGWGVAPPYQA